MLPPENDGNPNTSVSPGIVRCVRVYSGLLVLRVQCVGFRVLGVKSARLECRVQDFGAELLGCEVKFRGFGFRVEGFVPAARAIDKAIETLIPVGVPARPGAHAWGWGLGSGFRGWGLGFRVEG